jgi:hypothetical protein
MNGTEYDSFFKVAESRDIAPEKVAEVLISNGRQIYLHFIKEHMGTIEFEGLKKIEEPTTYRIEPDKIFPLTPDSRIDLVNALMEGKDECDLKVRIIWEEHEDKNVGFFIIKVHVNLMSNLVIKYEDLRFLTPHLLNTDEGHTVTDGSSPAKFFDDKYFHQLVLRTMKKEGSNWNIVKRNLRRHTLEDEKIKIIGIYNHEGEMRTQIQLLKVDFAEPYKVMESTFKKKLTAYRKHLRELPLPSNNR